MKKSLFVLTVVVAAGWVAFYYWQTASAARPEFRTAAVTRGPLVIAVQATGSVEPVETIDVGAQIVGKITEFGPDRDRPGKTIENRSRVKKGDLLAQLDDVPQRADQEKAVANLELARSDLAHCEAQLKLAASDYGRAKLLADVNSQAQTDTAEANYGVALSDVGVARAKLKVAEVTKKLADNSLDYTMIRAPVDGVLLDCRVNVGQTVVAGLNAPSLFLLARDLSRMNVSASVNEADIGDIHVGQKVTFTVDAYRDRVFSGTVSLIQLNANTAQNVVTYPVRVDVDNRDEKLLPSMTAKLQFEVARRSNVVLVPNQALRFQPTLAQVTPSERPALKRADAAKDASAGETDALDEETEPTIDLGSPAVWVVTHDGFVRPIAVKIGLSDGISTEITDGKLEPGMEVVIHAEREAQPDFVKSFISQVVNTKK